jgi:hypothetical protein
MPIRPVRTGKDFGAAANRPGARNLGQRTDRVGRRENTEDAKTNTVIAPIRPGSGQSRSREPRRRRMAFGSIEVFGCSTIARPRSSAGRPLSNRLEKAFGAHWAARNPIERLPLDLAENHGIDPIKRLILSRGLAEGSPGKVMCRRTDTARRSLSRSGGDSF